MIALVIAVLFATTTPEALIQSLYAAHQPAKDKNLDWCDKKTISKFADAKLTALFMKDCQCAKREGMCNLGQDPFYNAQDFDTVDPHLRIKRLAPNSYQITIANFGNQNLIYKMTQTPDGWRIADIEYPADKTSLVKLLSAKP